MSEPDAKASPAGGAHTGSSKPPRPPNPVWRMMGLPNFRFRLPSRNWLIFLTITGSWTAAVTYDRREKRRIQRKWAKVVEHIAQEPLDVHQLPRKLTVYLSAPPADGLLPARDHFNENVKPILVAAALDWDAIEGRREGDVRAGLAERIRRLRKKSGERSIEPLEEDSQLLLEETRKRSGVQEWADVPGDIVIGRHTWKEYVRGLHEGWLGPLDPPVLDAPESLLGSSAESAVASAAQPVVESLPTAPELPASTEAAPSDDASPTVIHETDKPKDEEKPKEEEKPKKKKQLPPFNAIADYDTAVLSPNCPQSLGPTAVIPLPHLLGFLNFPVRMYRFLNRRQVADEVGRQTAAAVLGSFRPYDTLGDFVSTAANEDSHSNARWEQQLLLQHEEPEWHKTVRERKDDDERERIWLDDMIFDPRIAERMKKFVLDYEAEERAKTIPTDKPNTWWSSLWPRNGKQKKPWEDLEEVD